MRGASTGSTTILRDGPGSVAAGPGAAEGDCARWLTRTGLRAGAPSGRAYRGGVAAPAYEEPSDETVRAVLALDNWAVIGCSPSPYRDSHRIAGLLQSRGRRVIPVNPAADEVLGERCYPSLAAVPDAEHVDVVDIFRRADEAGAHVDEAIERGARAVWLQLGVIDPDAAARAQAAGLTVVMDRCPAIEVRRLGI